MNTQSESIKSTRVTQLFSSRWGLILSVLGIAVGTGNIWRFPRIAAQNGTEAGAGAFLIAWAVSLFLFSIPLIIAEYGMGRFSRKGIIGTFIAVAGKNHAWKGGFVGFVATAIMFYYSVVAGWCLYYLLQFLIDPLPSSPALSAAIWDGFQGSWWPTVCHGLMMFIGGAVVIKGVSLIEKVNKILIPLLLVVLVGSLLKSVSLPGSVEGLKYLFTPDWESLLQPVVWLEALTQNAWDTGAAWGLILTYAVYMRRKDSVIKTALQTGVGNNIISLLAAVIIFSTVFAILGSDMSGGEVLTVMQTSGPASTGLTFIWMPQLFYEMSGGVLFAVLFFLGLTFAAFSSLISMIELAARVFIDMGSTRSGAVTGVCLTGFLLGLPSALDLTFFANQDFVWSIGLLISGAFISFAVVRFGAGKFGRELIVNRSQNSNRFQWWVVLISCIIPVEVITLLAWWIYQSVTAFEPDNWYNPLSTFSVATLLVQWGLAMIVLKVFNNRLVNMTSGESN